MTITCDDEARRAIADAIEAAVEHAQAAAQEDRSQDGAEYFANMVQDWVALARAMGNEDLAKSAENIWEELQELAMELEEEAEEEFEQDDEGEAEEKADPEVGNATTGTRNASDAIEAIRKRLGELRKAPRD